MLSVGDVVVVRGGIGLVGEGVEVRVVVVRCGLWVEQLEVKLGVLDVLILRVVYHQSLPSFINQTSKICKSIKPNLY